MKKLVMFCIFLVLLLSTTTFAQNAIIRGGRTTPTPPAIRETEIASYLLQGILVRPPLERFTVPFLFRQWHFIAATGQSFDLPDVEVMRDGIDTCVSCDSRRGWAIQQSANIHYYAGDETEYRLGTNNRLFDFRFSFYPSRH